MRFTVERNDDRRWWWEFKWGGMRDFGTVEAYYLSEAIDASLADVEHQLGFTANGIIVDGTHIVARRENGTHEWSVGRNWQGNSLSLGAALVDALRFTGMPIPSSIELTIGAATYRKPEET